MKFNKYTLKIENNRKTILYNLITKTLIQVDCNLEDCTVENIIEDIDDEMLTFFKERLLISDDYNDDFKEFLSLKDKYNSSEIGRFVIHLGYRCNLSCSYCYQTTISDCQKKQVIDIQKVVNFIINATTKEHYNKLDIAFIGGEPLIYQTIICDIALTLFIEICISVVQ